MLELGLAYTFDLEVTPDFSSSHLAPTIALLTLSMIHKINRIAAVRATAPWWNRDDGRHSCQRKPCCRGSRR